MPIVLRHFDVLTGEWIVLPNADPQTRQERPEVFLEETLNDTLLEAFTRRHFPNLPLDNTFSVAKISTTIDPQDLLPSSHPRRHALILTNGERAIYGPVEIRDFFHREINPDRLHNGAYGALFIGDCKHSYSGTATYLVVEDKTGENGGILPKELAYQLVGDSHGKVSAAFAREQWSDTHSHLLQFRLGDLTDDVYAKGVLAPKRMEQYFGDNSLGKKVDFIIPTSSFKGKGKSTVQPGLYEDHQIWIGEKARSKAGGIRASQLLEDHPTALWDLLPQMEVTRERLLEVMQSPTLLAKYYCENYEAHRQKQEPNWVAPTSEEAGERYRSGREQRREFLEGDLAKEQVEYNEFLYHALKADPDFKMYGMPAFTRALQDFFYQQFRDLGTGRLLKFDRAMIMPSKVLIDGEIFNSNYEEGERVIGFRSPILNANGETLHVNQFVEDILDPDGNPYEGVIVVPDEDIQRILTRVATNVRQIDPNINLPEIPKDVADLPSTKRMAFIDRFNQATLSLREQIPAVPYESISERWGSDYDGDYIGIGRAKQMPNLTRSVEIKQKPENMLPPVRKEAKQSFPEGTSFEEIAIHMADGISVGRINNVVTQVRALAAEQELYELMGTDTQKTQLAIQLQEKARALLADRDSIPSQLIERFESIVGGDPQNPQTIFNEQRQIYREMTGIACYHNQVAVDLFKSARKPDLPAVLALSQLTYRQPNYFRDKKQPATYRTRGLNVDTAAASPVELLALYTNEFFDKVKVQTSPVVGYKDLFDISFSQQQFLEVLQVKAQYDELHNLATQLDRQRKQEGTSFLRVQLDVDRFLDIVQVQEIAGAQAAKDLSGQEVTLKIVPTEGFKAKQYPNQVNYLKGNKWEALGFLSEFTPFEEKNAFRAGAEYRNFLSEGQIKLLFEQADKFVLDWRHELNHRGDAETLDAYASATWTICFNKDAERFSSNNFAFAAFGDRVIDRLAEGATPVRDFLVGQLTSINQAPESLWKTDEMRELVVLPSEDDRNSLLWHLRDGDRAIPFGSLSNKTYQPPAGLVVQAMIDGDIFSTARLDIVSDHPALEGQEIIIGNMSKYAAVGREFKGEPVRVIFTTDLQPEPQPLLMVDGKPLGRLNPAAIQMFQENGVYRHGISFTAELKVMGTGPSQRVLVKTAKGNLFQLEKSHFYGHPILSEPSASHSLTVCLDLKPPQNPALKVAILEKAGVQTFIGEFTPNQKATKVALMKAGLFSSGTEVDAKITSRVTAARLKVQSYQLPVRTLSNREITPTPNPFLREFRHRPTVVSLATQTWQIISSHEAAATRFVSLPTVNVDLDVRRIEGFKAFLNARNIPCTVPEWVSIQENENSFASLAALDDPEVIAWQSLSSQLQSRGLARVQIVQSDIAEPAWRVLEQLAYRAVDLSEASPGDNEKLMEVLQDIKPLTGVQRKLYHEHFENLPQGDNFSRRVLPTLVAPVSRPLPELSQGGKPVYQNTISIAVDPLKLGAVCSWLTDQGVTAEVMTPSTGLTPEEANIGYPGLKVAPEQWTEDVQAAFSQFFPNHKMESNLDYFVKINSLDRNEPTLKFSEKSELIFGEAKGQQQYPGAQFADNGSRNEGLTPTMTPASQPTLITDEHSPRRNLAVVSSKVKSVGVSEAIKHQNTNILSVEAGIVVQQVNRQGVMGAGLAKQFSDRYPDLLPQYREQLDSGRLKLGGVFFFEASDRLFIANIAAQEGMSPDRRQTDFAALERGLKAISEIANREQMPVYIPYRLGSGLAGGATESERQQTWEEVSALIQKHLPQALICHPTGKTLPQMASVSLGQKPSDLREVIPVSVNPKVEHYRAKDRAMAAMATQFIGFSSQPHSSVLSSTRDYQQAWGRFGLANTGQYSHKDTIMVSGSGPWRGVTPEAIALSFNRDYNPLLYQAVSAGSQFVVGTAEGMDQWVAHYLKEYGYKLTPHPDLKTILLADAPEISIPRTANLFNAYLDWNQVDRLDGSNFHVYRDDNHLRVTTPLGDVKLAAIREDGRWKSTDFNFDVHDFEIVSRFEQTFYDRIDRYVELAYETEISSEEEVRILEADTPYLLRLVETWEKLGMSSGEVRKLLMIHEGFVDKLAANGVGWVLTGLDDGSAFNTRYENLLSQLQSHTEQQDKLNRKSSEVQL